MSNIAIKSPATLMDELITTNLKIWFSVETLRNETEAIVVANAAKRAQSLNERRSKLIRALDKVLGYNDTTITEKLHAGAVNDCIEDIKS